MKKADPRVKLLWVFLCTSAALVFRRPLWLVGLGSCSLAGALLFGADLAAFGARLKRFLPLVAVISAAHILFERSGTPLLTLKGYNIITSQGLGWGLMTGLRLFVILCAAQVMAAENIRRVIAALTQMGVPYLFSFLLMIALRFLPSFSAAFSDALVAIQLRGVELKKIPLKKKLHMYTFLLLPVVAEATAQARTLAAVMEARGFGAFPRRTSYLKVRMSPSDWLLAGLLALAGSMAFIFYSS